MNSKLQEYKNWLERRNLTPETIQIRLRHVRQYGNQGLNTDNIVNFLKDNLTKYSPHHLRNLRNSLASYARFQKVESKIEWDLIMRIIPKVQPKLFPTINPEELKKLKNAHNQTIKRSRERDNLILDFFFYIGLRVSELVNIKHSDYRDGSLKVYGKGNKIRFVPIPDFLIKHFNHSDNYLFQTRWGKKLHPSQVRRMIYQRNKKANLNKHISPHTFRRSLATLSNNSGIKLTTIQKVLGHSDINTTSNYIHNSYEEIFKDYSKLWKLTQLI
ncbi:MAG: tyrosine recombinase XerD [Mycoplasmataceae bacterium RV_VA103A]|nr:MAG: tyrosine recombinase XerD [Mycoplasmataceae bacterium RV_VA103A]